MLKIGDYGYERYRYVVNLEGEVIKQGMGLEGVIKNIFPHPIKKYIIIEFDLDKQYRFTQIEFVTRDRLLKNKIITNTQRHKKIFNLLNE